MADLHLSLISRRAMHAENLLRTILQSMLLPATEPPAPSQPFFLPILPRLPTCPPGPWISTLPTIRILLKAPIVPVRSTQSSLPSLHYFPTNLYAQVCCCNQYGHFPQLGGERQVISSRLQIVLPGDIQFGRGRVQKPHLSGMSSRSSFVMRVFLVIV